MNQLSSNLKMLLRKADAVSARRPVRLDAVLLLERADARRRKRLVCEAMVGSLAILLVGAVAMMFSRGEKIAPPAIDIAQLTAQIESIAAETEALLAQIKSRDSSTDAIVARARLAALQEIAQAEELARLKSQLAELEAQAVEESADLHWATEWSRSGALRLELAKLDPDPQRAARSYQQIAKTYADSRWGAEARLALAQQ